MSTNNTNNTSNEVDVNLIKSLIEETDVVQIQPIESVGKIIKEKQLYESQPEFNPELSPSKMALRDRIQQALHYAGKHKDEIDNNACDMVAFYNLSDKKSFFFVTPQEARMAIEHIKMCREDGYHRESEIRKLDAWILELIKNSNQLVKNILPARHSSIVQKANIMFGKEWKLDINSNDLISLRKSLPRHTIMSSDYIYSGNKISVESLAHLFAEMEVLDTTVFAIIMNSTVYSEIRLWGQTISDFYTQKSIEKRLRENGVRVVGSLWTSEIYIDNQLSDNEIRLASAIDVNPSSPDDLTSLRGLALVHSNIK